MIRFSSLTICALLVLGFAGEALAVKPFGTAFNKKYFGTTGDDFKDAVGTAGCNVCHMRGQAKSERNIYGADLARAFEAMDPVKKIFEANSRDGVDEIMKDKENKKVLLEAFEEAMKKVETMKAEDGTTYGERIKTGKLPVDEEP